MSSNVIVSPYYFTKKEWKRRKKALKARRRAIKITRKNDK